VADIASITAQDAAQAEADAAAVDAAVAQSVADQAAAEADLAAAEAEIAAITAQDAADEAEALAAEEAANLATLNDALAAINASNQTASKVVSSLVPAILGMFGPIGMIAGLVAKATGFFDSAVSSISRGQTGKASSDLSLADNSIDQAAGLAIELNNAEVKRQIAIVKNNINSVKPLVETIQTLPPTTKTGVSVPTNKVVVDTATGKVVAGQVLVDDKGKVVPGQVAIDSKTGKDSGQIVQDKVTGQLTIEPLQASNALLPIVALAAGYLLFGQ
jgi:hypothetical protein